MQPMLKKVFGDLPMEEMWVEILAYGGAAWFCFLLACGGFMLGPIFTPYNNDPRFPGKAHYSFEGAAAGLVIGVVVSIVLLTVRYRAKKAEAALEAAADH